MCVKTDYALAWCSMLHSLYFDIDFDYILEGKKMFLLLNIFHAAVAKVARQLKNIRQRAMARTLYEVCILKFLRNYKVLLETFVRIYKDIMYIDT